MHHQQAPIYCDWGAWAQNQANSDYRYGIVDSSGTLPYISPYSSQAGSSELDQRQTTASQFMNNPYNSQPLPTTYPLNPGYYTPTPLVGNDSHEHAATPENPYFTRQYEERWQLPLIATTPHSVDQMSACPQGAGESSIVEVHSPSISIKADRQLSPVMVQAVPEFMPKTISKNISPVSPINGAWRPPSDNPVDSLLRVIQSKPDITSVIAKIDELSVADTKAAETEGHDGLCTDQGNLPDGGTGRAKTRAKPKKHLHCNFDGCHKSFSQKTQLQCHIRAHTGEKPYLCEFPGCGKSFSQKGNRTTHQRGHTGETPFKCPECGKGFGQGGNVLPHRMTHYKTKLFECKLDGCDKLISTKGNLKTHQTKYHRATLETLTRRFSQIKDITTASAADREMWKYLVSVHNNLNKGIKGCGGRRIRRVRGTGSPESSPPSTPTTVFSSSDSHYEPLSGAPFMNHGFSHPAADSLSRHNIMQHATLHLDIRMYDSDNDSMNSNAASPTSTATYDDEQEQRIIFGHRIF